MASGARTGPGGAPTPGWHHALSWCDRSSPTTSAWWPARWPISAWRTCGWSSRATAGPTRRRASPPPAPISSSMPRRLCPTSRRQSATSTGLARPRARQRDLAKPVLTPEQAVARDAPADGARTAMRHRVRAASATVWRPTEVANADAMVMAPVNPSFASLNLAQAVLLIELRMDEAGRKRHAWPRHHLRGGPAAGPEDARLAAGHEGGAFGLVRAYRARDRTHSVSSSRPKSAPAWCKTCARCSRGWVRRNRKSAPCGESCKALCKARAASRGRACLSDCLVFESSDAREMPGRTRNMGRSKTSRERAGNRGARSRG